MNARSKILFLRLIAVAALVCFGIACGSKPSGQVWNVAGEEWPPPVTEVGETPPLSPEEALQSFSLPPGFRVEIVAAEPLVADPVAIDIDPDGRIWVAEMNGWMTHLLPSERDDQHEGQIVVLEDTDGDGRMDESTVFLDSLTMPRGVLVMKEGVLVADPPHLWFARDTDGDLKADTRTEVRDDYGLPLAEGNPEATANSPTWGMDNWIHNTHYAGRLRRANGHWQYDSTLALGQWGLAMNSYGRYFRTWNANPLFVAMLDPHYYARNPHLVEVSGVDVPIAEDAREVWPIRPTWVNRGYRESVLREDGTLRTFTAASGPAVYRGNRYPEAFEGNVFVPEPAAHLVRRFEIIRHEDGTLEAVNAYDQAEFMASTDGRFRPVNLYSAPDGTLYVVDMYQGVIEHSNFLSQYLKHQIEKRSLLEPQGLGRIYRIVYEENPPRQKNPQLTGASNQELVKYLADPNGWWRDTAQQLLVERGATDVAPALEELVRSSESALARLHALWTLDGLGVLDLETLRQALSDDSPHVRAAAVRLSEPWLREGNEQVLQEVTVLVQDPSPKVRLQLAASLGEVPPPAADAALVRLLARASNQPYLIDAVASGLRGRELSFLRRLLQAESWRESREGYNQTVQTLAATIIHAGNPDQINQLLLLIGDQTDLLAWQRLALLEGIEALIPEGGLLKLNKEPPALDRVLQASDPEVREKARHLAERLVWPGKEGYTPRETTPLTAEAKQRFAEGEQVYQQLCVACHQTDGQGQEGIAPSLVGSEWALGQEKDAVRIVLDGKVGETGLMPPHEEKLSDEEIAAVLTYIRNAWENEASAVSPSLVKEVRSATAVRDQPWTEEELRVMRH